MDDKKIPVVKDNATHITKQNIIDIADRLFMTYGYRAVSTRKIADACGLTQPALYHHFKNKKTIYLEVVQANMRRTKLAIKKIVHQSNRLEMRIESLSYYMLMNHEVDFNQMFHDVRHEMDEETQKKMRVWWLDSYLNPVVDILKEAVNEKEIKSLEILETNEVELAYLLLDFIKSSFPNQQREWGVSERRQEANRKSKLISKLFLNGIGSSKDLE
ncbi:TetR/AcrR family transcriptional regulator [Radiobacillus deserti]|uniref:TetR/AcrR family transcriptional regulator n=1 Tax=Radiobacillus deserti TaxID=2594883 RepID=A0A516KKG9_9BACI|nr:TetR/AcrR family transcriptional regulator [Radiobacillus deserti]QDP41876.1 TetR/AcrR family transcriptional regulator [Radiobacillus deserti]